MTTKKFTASVVIDLDATDDGIKPIPNDARAALKELLNDVGTRRFSEGRVTVTDFDVVEVRNTDVPEPMEGMFKVPPMKPIDPEMLEKELEIIRETLKTNPGTKYAIIEIPHDD